MVKALIFRQVSFCENPKVRIFWTISFRQKTKDQIFGAPDLKQASVFSFGRIQFRPDGSSMLFVSSKALEFATVSKVGSILLMVVVSMLPHAEIGGNDHREDAPQFIRKSNLFLAVMTCHQHFLSPRLFEVQLEVTEIANFF